MPDSKKIVMDLSARPELATKLNGLFVSQISGGKRYDLAVMGRRRANATFFAPHASDDTEQMWFAMDLTPLVQDNAPDIVDYVVAYIDAFAADVRGKLSDRLEKS